MRWLVWVFACGCVASQGSDPDRAGGGEGETEHGTWDGPLTGLDDTDGTPRRVPAGDGGEGDTEGESVTGLCGQALDENVGLATRDSVVSLLRGDRTERQLFLLDVPPLPPDSYLSTDSVLGEDTVVVAAEWTIPGEIYSYGSALEVFEIDGSPRWGIREDGASFGSPRLGVNDTIVVSKVLEDGNLQMVLFDATGGSKSVDNFHARAGLLPSGVVPGYLSSEFEFSPGWMDPDTGEFQPVSFQASNAFFVDGRIVYLTLTSVIDEGPEGFEEYVVADGAPVYLESLSWPWLLLNISGGDQWARVSIETGKAEPVEIAPPPGSVSFDCYFIDPSIDAEGGILFPTRNEYAAKLTRYDPTSGKYSRLGSKRVNVEEMSGYTVGGTHFIEAVPPGFGFCDPQTWEPSNEELLEAGLEIVRPETGFRTFIEDSFNYWTNSNDDGTCLLLGSGSTTVLIDVLTGEKHDFGFATGFQFPIDPL